jgi:L-fucose/D-arabinose isomerase
MPVTLSRINIVEWTRPGTAVAEGYTAELPERFMMFSTTGLIQPGLLHGLYLTLPERGPFIDVYSVMANWGANHGAFSYGHIGADLISLASILRIPVCMHNVPDETDLPSLCMVSFRNGPKGQITGPVIITDHYTNR